MTVSIISRKEDFNYWGIINRGIDSGSYEGTLNGDLFLYFLENFLVPKLKSGNVVICDNASHKVDNVKELIESKRQGWFTFHHILPICHR